MCECVWREKERESQCGSSQFGLECAELVAFAANERMRVTGGELLASAGSAGSGAGFATC